MALQTNQSVGRDNNFNLLRIIAAGAVLVSHAYPLTLGTGAPEPLDPILGMSLGTLAVITFFAISGYFISQSFQNRRSILEFATARVLRVYPGLLVVLVLAVFAIGPLFTEFGFAHYFSDPETFLYIPRNLRLWPLQYELPGVFGENPYPRAINGSLWTLAYEIACYIMVAAIGLLGFSQSPRRYTVFLVAYAICYIAALLILASGSRHLEALRNIQLLVLPFVIGMSLFQFRKHISMRLPTLLALSAASAIFYGTPWFHELFVLAWCYGVLYLGFLRYKPLLAYNRLGDYSYGTYIYGFPVEQAIVALYKGSAPFAIVSLSAPVTLLFAILSWHYVEGPALKQKSNVLAWLRRNVKSPSFSR